jgi:nucleoside phosphorylase/CheY-like chemotaxis protein
MKILILEDEQDKRNDIINTLCNIHSIKLDDITICDNIIDGKRILRERNFDLLLLDINLPIRSNNKPEEKSGLDFYKEFKNDRRYNQPREIIGITAYEKEYLDVKKDFEESLIHIVHYHALNREWEEPLVERIEYVISSNTSNSGYNYDIAILCALDKPELEAIRKLTKNWNKITVENTSIPFYETYFEFENKKLKVVITSINKMGMVPTAVLSTQIIELFRPRYLAMTGIVAGIYGEVELGDILVVNPSWDSGSGKIKKDEKGNKLFEIDPRQETISNDIEYNILELSNDNHFLNSLRENWQIKMKNVITVHIGPVASGAAVIANSDITEEIQRQQSRKIIGIEMEAYGLIYAAKHSTNPKPEAIVIKSVCDFADENKNDGYQSYAAYTSANFLYEYIKRYIN